MPRNNWMVGAKYSSPKLEEHLEQLRKRYTRVQEHGVEFLSRVLEYQVLKDEDMTKKTPDRSLSACPSMPFRGI